MIQEGKFFSLDSPAFSVDNVVKFAFFHIMSKSGLVEKTTFRRCWELELMQDSSIST